MKYEDIKKMGEAYAQIQEKQRQENAKRAEEMLKQQEAYGAPSSKDDNDQVAQRKKLMKGQKNHDEGAKQGKSIKGTIQPGKKVGMKDDASNDKSDDGDGMDKGDPKAAKKKFKDRKDKDIDNDGDVDSSDEYLHKRRKAISKNSESKGKKEVEVQTQEKVKEDTVEEAFDYVPMHLRPGGTGPKKPLTPAEKQARIQKRRDNLKKGLGYRSEPRSKSAGNAHLFKNSTNESASTGAGKNSDSVAQDKTDGMSPNAKKELARATNEPAVDAEKSNKLNFASFKKMTKKSKDNG